MEKLVQSWNEWMASNPDVPDHIKQLMKEADGSSATRAPPTLASSVETQEDSDGSSESISESSCKLLAALTF